VTGGGESRFAMTNLVDGYKEQNMVQVWPVLFRKQNIVKGQRFAFKNASTPTVVRKLLHETCIMKTVRHTHVSETKSVVAMIRKMTNQLLMQYWEFLSFSIISKYWKEVFFCVVFFNAHAEKTYLLEAICFTINMKN